MEKTFVFTPVEGWPPTVAFRGYKGDIATGNLCSYCRLMMQCEIFNARRAMMSEFAVGIQIVECPRMIEETKDS
jgi:hypothetical protein